jgi:hypothetical protein
MSTKILHTACSAIQAWLEDQDFDFDINIYKGMEHETVVDGEQPNITLPAVTVSAMRASVDPPFSNNWIVDVSVSVRTNADDTTDAEHNTMADEVFDVLYTTTIAADLTAALANFTAELMVPLDQTFAIVERSYVSTFDFQLHCCNADLV